MNLYGLFLLIGVLAGLTFFLYLAKRQNLPTNQIIEKIFWIFILGLIGARLTYIILYSNQFSGVFDYFAIWEGGLVSYGGIIIGALTAFFLFQGKNLYLWLDNLSISFFIGWVFGRLGGFLTQNAQGELSPYFSKFFYHRVPIQLFEVILSLLIIVFSFYLLKKSTLKPGIIFWSNLEIYTFGRFVIDFWRDEQNLIFIFSLGQLFSFLLFFYAIMRLKKLK